MAQWKKVIVSGSVAELNTVSASLAVVVGAAGYNKIGIDQATTTLSGSFTGSFVGEGSGLTGLVSTLRISGSDASTGDVQLKTQDLTITGASNEINTSVSGQTVTIGLVDNPTITGDITIGGNTISSSTATAIELNGSDVEVRGDLQVTGNEIKSSTGVTNITLTAGTLTTFAGDIKVNGNDISSSTATALTLDGENVKVVGDLTVGGNDIKAGDGTTAIQLNGSAVTMPGALTVSGDLTVNGDLTYLNVANLAVEDKFILLATGSASPTDAGIVVDLGGGSGSAFAYDSATSRWGQTGSFNSTATSFTPDAFVSMVVTSDIPDYQKVGNVRIEGGEIYFYV
jgi:uncharacterized Zn-binding protein involved in type VI secretion